ncbi:MAG: hypothetical protein ACJAS3_003457 [Roseivirga sp.]|jgi:hypothetical protein
MDKSDLVSIDYPKSLIRASTPYFSLKGESMRRAMSSLADDEHLG